MNADELKAVAVGALLNWLSTTDCTSEHAVFLLMALGVSTEELQRGLEISKMTPKGG